MSEFDLLYLLNETRNSWASLIQWWASVSFALMVVAHFIGNDLRTPLVFSLVTLYTAFTLMMLLLLVQRMFGMFSILDELRTIDSLGRLSGVGKTSIGRGFGSANSALGIVFALSFGGTYAAAVTYLLIRFRRARTSPSEVVRKPEAR